MNDNKVHQQIIGIPTGTNCFVDKVIEDGNAEYLDKLDNIFRYQDDLITFGEYMTINKTFTEIYPNEMIIKNTNISSNHVTFLDLDIKVVSNKFKFKSYDKRNDFNFPIINYPNLSGNIPTKAAYDVFISQLVRYSTINLKINDFIHDIKILVSQLVRYSTINLKIKDFIHDIKVLVSQLVRYSTINLKIKDFIHDIKVLVSQLVRYSTINLKIKDFIHDIKVLVSQLVRYSTINLKIKDFIHDIKVLVSKLLEQGYKRNILVSSFKQFAMIYIVLW